MIIRHNENCIINYPMKESTDNNQSKEDLFYLEEEEIIGEKKLYSAFELIYQLANKGIVNLNHDDMEKKGVKVIL